MSLEHHTKQLLKTCFFQLRNISELRTIEASVSCGKEGAAPEGRALNLLVHLCSYPHLWSRDRSYKQLKWVSFGGWLSSAFEIGLEAHPPGRSSELSCCSSASKGVCRGGSGIWLGCLLAGSLADFLGMSKWEEAPGQTQNMLRDSIYLVA